MSLGTLLSLFVSVPWRTVTKGNGQQKDTTNACSEMKTDGVNDLSMHLYENLLLLAPGALELLPLHLGQLHRLGHADGTAGNGALGAAGTTADEQELWLETALAVVFAVETKIYKTT